MARSDVLVSTDWAQSNLDAPHTVFVEVDEDTSAYDGGHIPGAINRFFQDNLGPDGRFKQAAQLQEEFGKLIKGGDAHKVVAQCGSGVTACHNLLAMEAAGLDGARLYPGSWSEWCADPARPVATGA